MNGTSILEISESALRRNLRFLKNLIGQDVKFCSVVKGNAYGHGFSTYIPLAEKCGVDFFAVYNAEEAQQVIRHRTRRSDLMIMGCIGDKLDWVIDNHVSFHVFDINLLEQAVETAVKLNTPARIHLELETGMNRLGLNKTALEEAAVILRSNSSHVIVEGVCTHYAGAESVQNYLRIQQQMQTFREHCEWLRQAGIEYKVRHAASSAAAIIYPESHMEMVRIGIAQYGFWPSEEIRMYYFLKHTDASANHRNDPLRRILRWKSYVMSIKEVEPGEFVGYGTSYLTTRRSRFAVVPVGYSHGFNRNLSNKGHVLINGRRAPVAGIVNMSMIMADVTDCPSVQVGDEVVLIGKQKRMEISVGAFSDLTRFLNYEVLVRLAPAIPRIVVP